MRLSENSGHTEYSRQKNTAYADFVSPFAYFSDVPMVFRTILRLREAANIFAQSGVATAPRKTPRS